MTRLDEATKRLARRMSVARLGLAQGGPVELLDAMISPVESALADVREQMAVTEQPTFDPVDEPIGPATTAVLADIVSPVPATAAEDPAKIWDRGYASGRSNAMRYMSDEPNAPTTPNPYRTEGNDADR